MNENEAARIAAAANCLRPDWPITSLRTLLARPELARRSRRDVAVALAWVACESDTSTPARVIESGPWWRAANIETPDRVVRRPPQRHEECGTHPGEYHDFCRACVADRKAARDDIQQPSGRWTPNRIREQLRTPPPGPSATPGRHTTHTPHTEPEENP